MKKEVDDVQYEEPWIEIIYFEKEDFITFSEEVGEEVGEDERNMKIG